MIGPIDRVLYRLGVVGKRGIARKGLLGSGQVRGQRRGEGLPPGRGALNRHGRFPCLRDGARSRPGLQGLF